MCLEIMACCCPPIAVVWKRGCALEFWITLLLTFIAWLPGCCFACYIINQKDTPTSPVVTQVTNFQMAAPAPAPQNIVVNVNQNQSQGPTGSPYLQSSQQAPSNSIPAHYNQPVPMQPQYIPSVPMPAPYNPPYAIQAPYNPSVPFHPPPPPYSTQSQGFNAKII